jgi:hypothetical protein
MFENRMIRRTFGPKREEVTGGWRTVIVSTIYSLHKIE